jgi:hypothetical protein
MQCLPYFLLTQLLPCNSAAAIDMAWTILGDDWEDKEGQDKDMTCAPTKAYRWPVLEIRSDVLTSNGGIENAEHKQANVIGTNLVHCPRCSKNETLRIPL